MQNGIEKPQYDSLAEYFIERGKLVGSRAGEANQAPIVQKCDLCDVTIATCGPMHGEELHRAGWLYWAGGILCPECDK